MKAKINLRINSPLYEFNRHILPDGVLNRIHRSTWLVIENSDHPSGMVDHPFVSDLKAVRAIIRADVTHQISFIKNLPVPILPAGFPSLLKTLIGTGAYQLDGRTLTAELQHNLRRPDVHASGHSRNKDIQSVSDCLTDLLFQVSFDKPLKACQLFGAMTTAAAFTFVQ